MDGGGWGFKSLRPDQMSKMLNSELRWHGPPDYTWENTPRDGDTIYALVEEDVEDNGTMNHPPFVVALVVEHVDSNQNHGVSLCYRVLGSTNDYLQQDETVVAWRPAK